jgi:L-2-hydroxyglutarate oxidase
LAPLERLYERAIQNALEVHRLDAAGVREREPHCAAVAGLFLPITGIVDYTEVCQTLRRKVEAAGGEIRLNSKVAAITDDGSEIVVECENGPRLRSRVLVNCAGLYSDRIAQLAGVQTEVQILPFRGEYFELVPQAGSLVRGLIYPVPDPNYPFLGVHLTRGIDGHVHAGPNAVLAFAREGYRFGDIKPKELAATLRYPGFWHFARRHWRMGAGEYARSLSRRRFVAALQRLVPEISAADITPAPAGVRAQAVRSDGRLVDDFLFAETPRSVHVLNAPSPAATASLPIGEEIAHRALDRLRSTCDA